MSTPLLATVQELWKAQGHAISGPVDYRHMFIDISSMEVAASDHTKAGHTCLGAMGYSFAAGTTDGKLPSCTVPFIRGGRVLGP